MFVLDELWDAKLVSHRALARSSQELSLYLH